MEKSLNSPIDPFNEQPIRHFLFYGAPGSGKSKMASTLRKPQLIIMTDPLGKHTPYVEDTFIEDFSEIPQEKQPTLINVNGTWRSLPTIDCYADEKGENLLRRIVFINEPNTAKPMAYDTLRIWLPKWQPLVERMKFKSLILDSLSAVFVFTEYHFKAKGLPDEVPEGQWGFANMNRNLVLDIVGTINSLPIDTAMICHTSYETMKMPDMPVYAVQAPGKTKESLLAMFGDYYHLSLLGGEYKCQVSNEPNVPYCCNNSFGLKGFFPNNYEALVNSSNKSLRRVKR